MCILLSNGCLSPATSSKISISATAPWKIFVTQADSENGWGETLCLKCFLGGQEMILDEILFYKQGKPGICGWLKVRFLPQGSIAWFPSHD